MTVYDKKRAMEVARIENNSRSDGKAGMVFELQSTPSASRKTTVGTAGQTDSYIYMLSNNGKRKRVKAECKINGGRIDSILARPNGVVIYRLQVCNSNTQGLMRKAPAIVVPCKDFIHMLTACNAIKAVNHRGQLIGHGIQCTLKKWYQIVCDYPVKYEKEKVYTQAEFDVARAVLEKALQAL